MPISFTGTHVPKDMTRTGSGWDVAELLSTQNLGDMRLERHLRCDHFTMNRWVITSSPQFEATCYRRTRPVRSRWKGERT
jgi:transposase-like protein